MIKKLVLFAAILFVPLSVSAFCGFYVSKADTAIYNKASKVVIAYADDKMVVTMVNDYQGEAKEFAMVVPTPTVIKKEQVHITENAIIEHLDAYTAPRLVEYFDPNPCAQRIVADGIMMKSAAPMMESSALGGAAAMGIKIEEQYTVGEYDILVLSAEKSDGLISWLNQNGYKIPDKADKIVANYINQGMKFFVAKVNLKEQARLGSKFLRPLSVAFATKKFMLPIRLGTVNAKEPQELFIFTLTRNGRVESTNYRNEKLPSDINLPTFVKEDFAKFYKAMIDQQVKRDSMKLVYHEYAWDMGWCDPCAAEPMSAYELKELGVFWNDQILSAKKAVDSANKMAIAPMPVNGVFVTRMHLRYDAANFPDDLAFHETNDRNNFQARYVLHHPWNGYGNCKELVQYKASLGQRFEEEATNLARLTGWDINNIRTSMKDKQPTPLDPETDWYIKLWKE